MTRKQVVRIARRHSKLIGVAVVCLVLWAIGEANALTTVLVSLAVYFSPANEEASS